MRHTYILLIFFTISINLYSQDKNDSVSDNIFIPDYVVTQFAGNIGYLSAGIGYDLFHNVMKAELI